MRVYINPRKQQELKDLLNEPLPMGRGFQQARDQQIAALCREIAEDMPDWKPVETLPREVKTFWGWNLFDGVMVFSKGLGSDEYWVGGARAWAAPTCWMPYAPPLKPVID